MPSRKTTGIENVLRVSKSYTQAPTSSVAQVTISKEDSLWQNSLKDSKGVLIIKPNPCNMKTWEFSPGKTYYHKTHRNGSLTMWNQDWYEQNFVYTIISGSDWDDLYQEALQSYYNKLYKVDTNFLQIIAERNQTFSLITTTCNRLGSLYRSLKRGKNPFKGFSRVRSKDAGNLWLEYSYAWTPLVNDVYNLINLHKLEPPPFQMSVSKYKKHQANGTISPSGLYGETDTVTKSLYRVTLDGKVTLNDPGINFLNQLGITNPALLAWELVPYSFVVDWFLPIGDWLKWHGGLHGCTLSDTNITRSEKRQTDFHKHGSSGSYYGTWYTTDCYCSVKHETRYREVKPLGTPSLELRFPNSWSQAVSAIALMRQRFK
jgi:hypothetical protein